MIDAGPLVLDTNCLIYALDDPQSARGAWLAKTVVRPTVEGALQVSISTVTLAELLVRPYSAGDAARASALRRALETLPGLTVVPLTADIASAAAQLRASAGLRLPDAMIVATAASLGAAVLTNDQDLNKPGLSVPVLLLDREMSRAEPA